MNILTNKFEHRLENFVKIPGKLNQVILHASSNGKKNSLSIKMVEKSKLKKVMFVFT